MNHTTPLYELPVWDEFASLLDELAALARRVEAFTPVTEKAAEQETRELAETAYRLASELSRLTAELLSALSVDESGELAIRTVGDRREAA